MAESTRKQRIYKSIPRIKLMSNPRNIHSTAWSSLIEPQKSRLLNLPGEIRNKIWGYVLANDTMEIRPARQHLKFMDWASHKHLDISALAHTCQQIYVDVIGGRLIYGPNHFSFDDPRILVRFCQKIGPESQNLITSIRVRFEAFYQKRYPELIPPQALTTISKFGALTKLKVEIHDNAADTSASRVNAALTTLKTGLKLAPGVLITEFQLDFFRTPLLVMDNLPHDHWTDEEKRKYHQLMKDIRKMVTEGTTGN